LRTLPQPVVPVVPIDETNKIVVPIPDKYRLDPSAPVAVSTGTSVSASAPAKSSSSAAPIPH
jgi:hypothetical protein